MPPCQNVLNLSAHRTLERSLFGVGTSGLTHQPLIHHRLEREAAFGISGSIPGSTAVTGAATPPLRSKTGSLLEGPGGVKYQHSWVTPMVDRLAPTARHFARSQVSALAPIGSVNMTHMVMHPDRMPAHCCDEVASMWLGRGREVTFHGQESLVIGCGCCSTCMRYKLGEWKGLLSVSLDIDQHL